MADTSNNRGQWGSRWGFILAAAGSAVGLGNIWRFPYITGENGGGAFVFVYLICVLLIGIPLLFNEVALGRYTRKNPIGAVQSFKVNRLWLVAPILCVVVCFFVLSYYSVIAGWTIGYIFSTFSQSSVVFEEFIADATYVVPLMAVFILMTILIVLGGVSGGIEKAAKILMPVLLLLILIIVGRSLSLEGAAEGVAYYLKPDFSKINGEVVLAAIGQAFFSMSVGWGLMVTYGSYFPQNMSIINAGLWVAFLDSVVALLGGLMIFPAVFAFGHSPEAGPTLIFQVLPQIFAEMPGGHIIGALFFLLLCIAALTSSISMLEVPVSYLIDEQKWNRKKAAWIVGGLAIVAGLPSALSQGASEPLSKLQTKVTSVYAANEGKVSLLHAETEDCVVPKTKEKAKCVTKITKEKAYLLVAGEAKTDTFAVSKGNYIMANPGEKVLAEAALITTITHKGFLDILDMVFGTFVVVIISLLLSLFVGWAITTKYIAKEVGYEAAYFERKLVFGLSLAQVWTFFIRIVCPIVIIVMLIFSVTE